MVLSVAIAGAGPAGCTLARLLLKSNKGIKVTIFENEASINFRSQGGTLDLREGGGLSAIKAADLWDEFIKHARYDGESLKIADKKFVCYIKMSATKEVRSGARPEIDRAVLRKILFDSLPSDCVKWSHKLIKVDDDLTLHFANQPSQRGFDLVIGADGAWSRVRPRLSDAVPAYSGIGGYQMSIPDAERKERALYDAVNRGSIFSYSDHKGIFAQQMGDGSLSTATWTVRDENWQETCGYDPHDPVAAKQAMAKDFADWNPKLTGYLLQSTENLTPRNLYMLPIGHRWEHVQGVTLIGDAAHLATPFAGIGVNMAMEDALSLSQAIISAAEAPDEEQKLRLDKNVKAFEESMFERATKLQQLTFDSMNFIFYNPDTPRSGIEAYIITMIKDEMGLWAYAVAPFVYLYYCMFKLFHQ